MVTLKIGVLALQGDVLEHIDAIRQAAKNLKLNIDIKPVRTKELLRDLDGLIIPGGESTTFFKLCERAGIFEDLKKIKNIFGTCAGAIMLSKEISGKTADQKTLELMDITIDRNAYGRQTDSFEEEIKTELGVMEAVFIRAPKIRAVGRNVRVLAKNKNGYLACEERINGNYYLAVCFHPELTTIKFHEYFLKHINN